jgi:hypothetical protein
VLRQAVDPYTGVAGRKDEPAAKQLFLKAAKAGDPLAKMWTAKLYFIGACGFSSHKTRAQELATAGIPALKKLATADDREATFLLGYAFRRGLGVSASMADAIIKKSSTDPVIRFSPCQSVIRLRLVHAILNFPKLKILGSRSFRSLLFQVRYRRLRICPMLAILTSLLCASICDTWKLRT